MQRVYILAPDVPGTQGRKSVTQTLANIELKKCYEINEKREEKTLKSSMVLSCPLLCLSRCLSLVWTAAVKLWRDHNHPEQRSTAGDVSLQHTTVLLRCVTFSLEQN